MVTLLGLASPFRFRFSSCMVLGFDRLLVISFCVTPDNYRRCCSHAHPGTKQLAGEGHAMLLLRTQVASGHTAGVQVTLANNTCTLAPSLPHCDTHTLHYTGTHTVLVEKEQLVAST